MTKFDLLRQFKLEPDLHDEIKLALVTHALGVAAGDPATDAVRYAKLVVNQPDAFIERFSWACLVECLPDTEKLEKKLAGDLSEMHVDVEERLGPAIAKHFTAFV